MEWRKNEYESRWLPASLRSLAWRRKTMMRDVCLTGKRSGVNLIEGGEKVDYREMEIQLFSTCSGQHGELSGVAIQ